ncbi:hypothetical protein HDU67_000418 [Dinochytrium kinnereticum]|nr:hypothetical protein HDU67_000418 [Dinochytrium kinnereticum]
MADVTASSEPLPTDSPVEESTSVTEEESIPTLTETTSLFELQTTSSLTTETTTTFLTTTTSSILPETITSRTTTATFKPSPSNPRFNADSVVGSPATAVYAAFGIVGFLVIVAGIAYIGFRSVAALELLFNKLLVFVRRRPAQASIVNTDGECISDSISGNCTLAQGLPSDSSAFYSYFNSTQQIKCVGLDSSKAILFEDSVHFDSELPHYKTNGGTVANGLEVHSSPIMWVEALELLLGKMEKRGVNFGEVQGIGGCAQQHASVFWNAKGVSALKILSTEKTLKDQLEGGFSLPYSPNWQDMSTTTQCRILESSMGDPSILAKITGSIAHERFTASQLQLTLRMLLE